MTDDLIKRLQAGPGSRELSDEVLREFGWECLNRAAGGKYWVQPSWWRPYQKNQGRPDPSRNVQDALDVVVPKDAAWSVSASPDRFDRRPCGVVMCAYGKGRSAEEYASTPALALCIAGLMAKEKIDER